MTHVVTAVGSVNLSSHITLTLHSAIYTCIVCMSCFPLQIIVFIIFCPIEKMLKTDDENENSSNNSAANDETLLLDSLLDDIYSHHNSFVGDNGGQTTTNESDSNNTLTASSSAFDADRSCATLYSVNSLSSKNIDELREIRSRLLVDVNQFSGRLVRLLKQRDITNRKVEQLANILTAVLQATSAKTAADAKLSFSLAASPGESGWQKWVDAMRAISRLPGGIPGQFRRKLWVGLADNYLASNRIDWCSVARTAFNEKSNPDDSALGLQIVKDLHRTGCSNTFLPPDADAEAERTLLKRVLLAYARWNKQVGYCQGFNVLATVILDTVDRNEGDALKVMIYLIDHVLPANYYSNRLRLLAVDLAVFRHLLTANLPQLAQHLDKLQKKATTADDGIFYEPPLTNVFLMQWLLTLYATCLPKLALLRFWDCLLLNGSDALLSAGLHIFTKLSKHIMACSTVDQYYTSMEKNVKTILRESKPTSATEADAFIQAVYKQLTPSVGELREQLLYSIQPFMAPTALSSCSNGPVTANGGGNNQAMDQPEGHATLFGCFSSVCGRSWQHQQDGYNKNNEAYISGLSEEQLREIGAVRERMTTDLKKLRRNYDRLAKKRESAVVVVPTPVDSGYETANDSFLSSSGNNNKLGRSLSITSNNTAPSACFVAQSSDVINHLLVSKVGLEEVNQRIVACPILELVLPPNNATTTPPSPLPRLKSPQFMRRRFLPATSTANKYENQGDDDTGFSGGDNSMSLSAITLTLDSTPPQTDSKDSRPVLSSLPTSPERMQQKSNIENGGELVEIDISSDFDYTGNYEVEEEDEQQTRHDHSDSENGGYFDKFGQLDENSLVTANPSSTAYYYAAARRTHYQQQMVGSGQQSSSHDSPFPISAAAKLKQRLHLIPGVKTAAGGNK